MRGEYYGGGVLGSRRVWPFRWAFRAAGLKAPRYWNAVSRNGAWRPGRISSTEPGFAKTVVLYTEGQRRAAEKVARDLGVDKDTVEPLEIPSGTQ